MTLIKRYHQREEPVQMVERNDSDSLATILQKSREMALNKFRRPLYLKVNINTASSQKLIALPGVGEEIAKRIIAYREKEGKFKRIEELMKVKGIGKKTFEKLKDYITVEGDEK